MLTEDDLRSGLRDMTAAPPAPAERFAAVERRALLTRRRRQSAAAGLVAVAVLAVALPSVLPERRYEPPAAPAPVAGFPRDVLLAGNGRLAVLPDAGGSLRPIGAAPAPEHAGQLATGEIVGVGGDRLLRYDETPPRDLGAADAWFPGLSPGELWRVVDQSDDCLTAPGLGPVCFSRYDVQRIGVDGTEREPAIAMLENVRPVGEVAGGLVAIRTEPRRVEPAAGGGAWFPDPVQSELVLLDPRTGAVRSVVARKATVVATAAGVLVWRHEPCGGGAAGCQLRVDGPDGTRLFRSDELSTASDVAVSPDGRWLAHAREGVGGAPGDLVVVDLRTGDAARLPYDVDSIVWSRGRLLFVTDAGLVGVYVAESREARLSAPVDGGFSVVLGALDRGRD